MESVGRTVTDLGWNEWWTGRAVADWSIEKSDLYGILKIKL